MPEPSPAVEAALRSWLEAKTRGDREAIASMLSADPCALGIGTEEGEWLVGPDAFIPAHRDAGAFDARIVELTAYEQGTVAWAAAKVQVEVEADRLLLVRVSLVLVEGGDGWKVVHSHASVPSDATW
jgi:ketosteroid isomerase-like protein